MMHLKHLKTFLKEFKNKKVFALLPLEVIMEPNLKIKFSKTFAMKNGISLTFSSLIIPQQNGVVERKNRTLVEMARTMFHEYNLPLHFWRKPLTLLAILQIEYLKDQF